MAKNYIIENGGLNFYEELYKSLDQPIETSDLDLCLITSSPLTENWVQLECNHKFNYVPLYNDILNHKKIFNKLEGRILKSSEIRCPYCRNIQTKLLPYHDITGVKLTHGVNYFDETVDKISKCAYGGASGYFTGTCVYNMKYCTVLDNGSVSEEIVPCTNTYVKPYHLDGKTYCMTHKYFAMKEYNKQQKLKVKQEAAQAKAHAKAQEKEAKAQAKAQEKEAKAQAKAQEKAQAKKKPETIHDGENFVVMPTLGCVEILKSGPKKGMQCCCKIKQDNLCGRHMKIH